MKEILSAYDQKRIASEIQRLQSDVGKEFHRLTVLEITTCDQVQGILYKCKCECGVVTTFHAARVRSGAQKECRGCSKSGKNDYRYKHGQSRTRTYRIWITMIYRCASHPPFIEQGITVCPRWAYFDLFLQDMGEQPKGSELYRIDRSGPFSPSNCKWAPKGSALKQTRGKKPRKTKSSNAT